MFPRQAVSSWRYVIQPLDLNEALAAILADIEPIAAAETIACAAALGRVAAADILAPVDLPPFPASAMDGYALRSGDVTSAPSAWLEVIGVSSAGHPFNDAVPPGTCVRILTGAAVPAGLDAIAIQEECVRDGDRVQVQVPVAPGDNLRPVGHDVRRGNRVLAAGAVIDPFRLAWLAACGITQVAVRARPRVAIFSTGDELAEPGATLQPGCIHDANRHALLALFAQLPVALTDLGIIPDAPEALNRTLEHAAGTFDAVITSGGVSVGDADYVREVVDRIGTVAFWRINLKPGKPLAYGRLGNARLIGLPGNPVSTLVTALLLARPALLRLAGAEAQAPTMAMAELADTIRHKPGREEYQRGWLQLQGSGLRVAVTGDQSSNRLESFATANCLIRVPKAAGDLPAGSTVTVLPFTGLL